MVFLGFRFHFRTTGSGKLHCQRCGGDREYLTKVGWRWLHLFFIPVLPVDRIAEHVQCTSCGTRYRTEVLTLPTSSQMLLALPAATRAAVVAMVRAGEQGGGARASAIDAIRNAGLPEYDEANLAADLAADGQEDYLAEALAVLAVQLRMPAHEWFLADVVRVGLADGQLSPDQRHAARKIAACLGMTAAQAHGVILMAEESAAAG